MDEWVDVEIDAENDVVIYRWINRERDRQRKGERYVPGLYVS